MAAARLRGAVEDIQLDTTQASPQIVGAMARLLAAAPSLNVEHAVALLDACRRAGALEDLGPLIERLRPHAAEASLALAVGDALQGRDLMGDPAAAGPVPFVRLREFLPRDLHAQILQDLQHSLGEFGSSPVLEGDKEVYADDRRRSLTRRAMGPYQPEFERRLKAALLDIADVAGLIRDPTVRLDLHCQVHGDGDFFAPHSDAQTGRWGRRLVSVVYYLHSQPRAFRGGDLLIFDRRADGTKYNPSVFTRVSPDDNSLVVFPASAVHEVEPLQMPEAPLACGRFTVVGALLAQA